MIHFYKNKKKKTKKRLWEIRLETRMTESKTSTYKRRAYTSPLSQQKPFFFFKEKKMKHFSLCLVSSLCKKDGQTGIGKLVYKSANHWISFRLTFKTHRHICICAQRFVTTYSSVLFFLSWPGSLCQGNWLLSQIYSMPVLFIAIWELRQHPPSLTCAHQLWVTSLPSPHSLLLLLSPPTHPCFKIFSIRYWQRSSVSGNVRYPLSLLCSYGRTSQRCVSASSETVY